MKSRADVRRLLCCANCVEGLRYLLIGSLGRKADDNGQEYRNYECGQQLIDIEYSALECFANDELPNEYGSAAAYHARECAPLGGASPEECAEDNGAECSAEACPCKRDDTEYRGARVACEEDTYDRDDNDRDTGKYHLSALGEAYMHGVDEDILRNARGCSYELRVCGRHCGCEDTGDEYSCNERRDKAETAYISRDINDNGLSLGVGGVGTDDARGHQAVADDADEYRDSHRDNHPYRGNAAGFFELIGVAYRHKAEQDVRHSEVAETPCECGDDRYRAVARCRSLCNVKAAEEVGKAVERTNVCKHLVKAADEALTETEHDKERNRHDDALNKVGGRCRKESAERTVQNYNYRADYHCGHIVDAEHIREELAACREAGSGVGDEEDDYNDCGNGGEHVVLIAEAA